MSTPHHNDSPSSCFTSLHQKTFSTTVQGDDPIRKHMLVMENLDSSRELTTFCSSVLTSFTINTSTTLFYWPLTFLHFFYLIYHRWAAVWVGYLLFMFVSFYLFRPSWPCLTSLLLQPVRWTLFHGFPGTIFSPSSMYPHFTKLFMACG